MASVMIAADASVISFIQVWTMPDPTHQQRWLQTMHERIGVMIPQPGFVSMTLHSSLDGTGTVVYAQWCSQEELEMAINQPQAKDGHQALAQWGESAGTVYHTDSVYTPETPHRAQITDEATVATFINVWKTPTVEHQRQLIEAMNGEMNSMTQKPGFVSLTIHASLDGQSVVVYAQWRSREDFDRAIAHDEQALKSRLALSQWGEPRANLYRVDAVFLADAPPALPNVDERDARARVV